MAVSLPNGTVMSIASGYGSALTVSAVTNASPAVCTSTAHGLVNGDFVEVTSGWSKVTNRIFRVSGSTTNAFSLEGLDTTLTSLYPAGAGAGSVRKITGWTQLQQILSTSSEGGTQNFATYQFLEADNEVRIPTNKAAAGLNIEIADDPTLAGYVLASTANDDRLQRAVKAVLSNASILLYSGYISVVKTPSMDVNQPMKVKATVSFLNAEPVRYAS